MEQISLFQFNGNHQLLLSNVLRKTRHKMVKLKPFMDYIDMRLAENVWNSEVIFAEIKAMG
ncbi:hypothetical protein F9428_23315, partial [Escherichia coli]|nr:hypothetical protein [Escherichia coli]